MKKFKFQLETLLKVTKMKKEEAEVELGKASRKLEEARTGLETLLAEMQKGQQDYDALSQEGTRVTIGRLMSFNSFFAWKREQIEMQQNILLQVRGEPACRARIIAANNILNAMFMVVGSLAAGALLGAGLSIPRLFLLAALLNGVV